MAATSIIVENRSDLPITAKLTWGLSDVGAVDIATINREVMAPPPEGSIPCEYVWYDLAILYKGGQLATKAGIRGGTSRFFDGSGASGYRIWERPRVSPPVRTNLRSSGT